MFNPNDHCRIMLNKGAKKDLWIMHGFFSKTEYQDSIADYFFNARKDYNVIQCDARGHGTRSNENKLDWEGTISDFSGLIDERKNDAVIIGHSVGATEAITMGIKNPHVKQVFAIAGGHGEKEIEESDHSQFVYHLYSPTKEEEQMIRNATPDIFKDEAKKSDCDFYLISSTKDDIVTINHHIKNKEELGVKEKNTLVYDPLLIKPNMIEHLFILYLPRTRKFIEKNLL